ncbi:hypothetical protein HWB96_gp26 [Arthrobacter phage Mendel]|uniref:Uncharacterized protein n=1 Tax=Arthrobacter phage Mendel TaxID=2484218 RepID=A0A3G3M0L0_9CAUD|nr:hypothetical protein HWB96_gp26 [Arthrobacter phage Mendel]AYQ99940.1 hypothetical protein PBI_MENDEL_26 [Arthrobacter phage Mendel]
MIGWIIYAIVFAGVVTSGIYAIDAGTTAEQPPIGRHRKGY